ncbi:cytochrome c biogenesis protein CcsA [Ravibacter arvi]|uniref:Cytochrome c biogenesis protein CcsA n=1 Tax=Ravibacter arvi TaxID=2051041 RepID=A0ABP8LLR0_9BACT
MYHLAVGKLGHLFVIIAFVSALVAAFGYVRSALSNTLSDEKSYWKNTGRNFFFAHSAAVLGVIVCLYWIILNHYFEYNYAWSNSSRSMPRAYVISSFWQNQEGSFLLWIFWNMLLGLALIATTKLWEGPVMAIFAMVQAFLMSMILGVIIPGIDLKIGSTPFLLLKEALPDLAVWKMDPDFVPKDGNGLNPLLQNYWMVIHPPTLFLGFSASLIPFSFAIAGLWLRRTSEWIRPALPWTLFAALVLGLGILMGGYWAYETLNFGGYWNWDPVENTSFVPWVVLVATIHTMIISGKNATALKTSYILSIAAFLLILYSTFMTRSGILGNASVHSFTDLGLSGQLLVYMLFFMVVAIALMVYRWKTLPSDEEEVSTYSREFWIFIGATVLCLSSFQILATTSIPVYNKIGELFGMAWNLALPTDQIAHYNKFQLWFYIVVALLTGVGQYFWWKKVGKGKLEALYVPLILTFVISSIWIYVGQVKELPYILLLTAAIFAVVSNGAILVNIIRGNYKLSGGAITHIGAALMLIGILFSSGYSKVVSMNNSGLMISRSESFTANDNKENRENVMLWYNKPERMGDYQLTWKDVRVEVRGINEYVPSGWLETIEKDFRAVALQDITLSGKTYFSKGDTVEIYPDNFYYEIEYRDPAGKIFTLFPRVQINPGMGGIIASPGLRRDLDRDLYTYIQMSMDPTAEPQWSPTELHTVAMRDTFFLNDYVAVLDNVVRTDEVEGVPLKDGDAAVKAIIRVLDRGQEYTVSPTFIIRDNTIGRKAETNKALGLRIQLNEIDPKTGMFTFGVNRTQRDYVVMKAIEKPLINLLWVGTFILMIGFGISTVRRYRDFIKKRDREVQGENEKKVSKKRIELNKA